MTASHSHHYFDSQDTTARCTRGDGCTVTRGEVLAEREARTEAATARRTPAVRKDTTPGHQEVRDARNERRRARYACTGR